MAERQYFHSYNGQEVEEDDINLMGEDGALADDRVLADLFRMQPYDLSMSGPKKGILPYGSYPFGGIGTVTPSGPDGSVLVNPFRALVASPILASTNAKKNWRDIRSSVFVGSSTTLAKTQSLSPNSSGFQRWDLVYVRVDVDVEETGVTRYIKTAGPPVAETPTTVSVVKATTCTIGVVTGTAGATPALPSLPSDSAGAYYIPLAYIPVQNGHNSTTQLGTYDIWEVAPFIPLSATTGAVTAMPANSLFTPGSTPLQSADIATWANTDVPPEFYMPPTMVGEEIIWIPLHCKGSSTDWSHQDNTIVDNSRDWRNRVFTWFASAIGTGEQFAWHASTSTPVQTLVPGGVSTTGPTNTTLALQAWGMGQSFCNEDSSTWAGGDVPVVCLLGNFNMGTTIASPNYIVLYVDTLTGALRFTSNGTSPNCYVFIRLCASGRFTNRTEFA